MQEDAWHCMHHGSNLQHAHLTSVKHLTMPGMPLETGRTPDLSQLSGLASEQPMKQQQTV